jgi:hypothetical protein
MVSKEMEYLKHKGLGGTAVVPLCNKCHNCRGAQIRLKNTRAVIDRWAPVDQRVSDATGAGSQQGRRPGSTRRSRAL